MRYWILPLALAMIHAGVSEAEVERQSQGTGACSVEADLVDLDGGWVTLRTTGGKLIDLPAAKLSRADQRWVRTRVPAHNRPTCRSVRTWKGTVPFSLRENRDSPHDYV